MSSDERLIEQVREAWGRPELSAGEIAALERGVEAKARGRVVRRGVYAAAAVLLALVGGAALWPSAAPDTEWVVVVADARATLDEVIAYEEETDAALLPASYTGLARLLDPQEEE
jgi:hypothetical protein